MTCKRSTGGGVGDPREALTEIPPGRRNEAVSLRVMERVEVGLRRAEDKIAVDQRQSGRGQNRRGLRFDRQPDSMALPDTN
jgi:hypothetical protein